MVQPIFHLGEYMTEDVAIYQEAYCITYGYTQPEDCDKEPSMIEDSPLITEELIKKFDDHKDIKLLTFSTGNSNVNKSILTFQLISLTISEIHLFKIQMNGNTNGLYNPEVHETPSGAFVSISTSNVEKTDVYDPRLERWINNTIDVIEATRVSTKNFVPENRENYNQMNLIVDQLEPIIEDVSQTVETGVGLYTEQQQKEATLAAVTEEITEVTFDRIMQLTQVRDILLDPKAAIQVLSNYVNKELGQVAVISNFDNITNNILDKIQDLTISTPDNIKNQIINELSDLKDIPQDELDKYTKDIFEMVDSFPFSSVDSIKANVLGLADELSNGHLSDGLDFISDPEGNLLSLASTAMDKFGITAARHAVEEMTRPGKFRELVTGYSQEAVQKAMDELPNEEINTVLSEVEKFKNYLKIDPVEVAEEYAQELVDRGIEATKIKGIVKGLRDRVDEYGEIVDKAESGVMDVLDAAKKLTEIAPTLEEQLNNIVDFANSADSLLSSYNVFDGSSTHDYIETINDMAVLLKDPIGALAQSCGAGGSAQCLISFGLKGVGLL